jgi:hypothetical protein
MIDDKLLASIREQLPPPVVEGRASNVDIVLGGEGVLVHLSPTSARVFRCGDDNRVLVGSISGCGAPDPTALLALVVQQFAQCTNSSSSSGTTGSSAFPSLVNSMSNGGCVHRVCERGQ